MIKKWWNTITQLPEVAGLEVYTRADGTRAYNLIVLKRDKNNLSVSLRKAWTGELSSITEFVPSSTPILLTIGGKGVLVKKLNEVPTDNIDALSRILPNAKPDDFYLQRTTLSTHSFFGLVRKEFLNSILKDLQGLNFLIAEIHCGSLHLAALGPVFQKTGQWIVPPYAFEYINNELKEYQASIVNEFSNTSVVLAGETLMESEVPAFAAALTFMANLSIAPIQDEAFEHDRKEVQARRTFQVAMWAALIFFLSILLINFLLFSSFSETNNALQQQNVSNASLLKELEKTEKDVDEKKNFLSTTGWLSSGKQSFFADKIAASIPNEIGLSELLQNPYDEKNSKTEKKKIFIQQYILVRGTCARATALNAWLETIKLIPDVESVKLLSYNYSDQERKGKFELEIRIKE